MPNLHPATGADLAKTLIGRTIVNAEWFEQEGWGLNDWCHLTLDDGREVCFSATGYDAYGVELYDLSDRTPIEGCDLQSV